MTGRRRHPDVGTRVRYTRRAARYRSWPPDDCTGSCAVGEPYGWCGCKAERVSSKDGIPDEVQKQLLKAHEPDAHARIHEWPEEGEGVIVGLTSRSPSERLEEDGQYAGQLVGSPVWFYEVKTKLRGRRLLVPLDAIKLLESPMQ